MIARQCECGVGNSESQRQAFAALNHRVRPDEDANFMGFRGPCASHGSARSRLETVHWTVSRGVSHPKLIVAALSGSSSSKQRW